MKRSGRDSTKTTSQAEIKPVRERKGGFATRKKEGEQPGITSQNETIQKGKDMTPINILEEVKDCRTIGISGHIRPDGDCVGSCMGMALYLENAMPEARIDVFLEELSQQLERNICGSEQIRHDYETDVERYDVFICLDCEKARLGSAEPFFDKAKKRINIDHHKTNPGSGDVNYVVPDASSACELAYTTMDEQWITKDVAQNLYIGMVTDTGVFAYSNTGRRTMEIAGRLMDYGFDFPAIIREVFYVKSYIQQQIMGRALLESIRFLDGKCIVSRIDRQTMKFFQAGSSDMEGIASELLHTDGVVCSIFMYELAPMKYKVSLRSTGEVDVSEIAAIYGGGGHARAAGCTCDGAHYHDIVNTMSAHIEEQLKAGVHV